MWLTGRLAPDFKTIADFRHDNGKGIRNVCRRFVMLCRDLKLFSQALVAIDGSKFKAVNSRDRSFTAGKIDKRQEQIEESIQRYLNALETADRRSAISDLTDRCSPKVDLGGSASKKTAKSLNTELWRQRQGRHTNQQESNEGN